MPFFPEFRKPIMSCAYCLFRFISITTFYYEYELQITIFIDRGYEYFLKTLFGRISPIFTGLLMGNSSYRVLLKMRLFIAILLRILLEHPAEHGIACCQTRVIAILG